MRALPLLQREHYERVSIVEAAMEFQDRGFVLPPPWDEDLDKENRLMEELTKDKQHGLIWSNIEGNPSELTWDDVQKVGPAHCVSPVNKSLPPPPCHRFLLQQSEMANLAHSIGPEQLASVY